MIGYAYEERFSQGALSTVQFLKLRLVRLYPMVLMGVLMGAIAFMAGGCRHWDGTVVPLSMLLVACCLNIFMLPVPPGTAADVRGNGEMFPLNGPHWSLFFEFIGNVIYALVVQRLSTRLLAVVTGVSGAALAFLAIGNASGYGTIGMGWTLADNNLWGGMCRLMFSFTAGLLLYRLMGSKLRRPVKHAFTLCSLLLIAVMAVPHVGGDDMLWLNGLYETLVVIDVFPAVVYVGATAREHGRGTFTRFMGRVSYPVYAIHYPLMYLFYAWVWSDGLTFGKTWHVAVGIFFSSIILAWVLLRWYDEPLRKYLKRRLKC